MSKSIQKIISVSLLGIVMLGGLEALVYILNLNQIWIFTKVAIDLYIYLLIKVSILYGIHYKNPGAYLRARAKHEGVARGFRRMMFVLFTALYDRVRRALMWENAKKWLNYLLLPGTIFWSTVAVLYLNQGQSVIQQSIVVLSVAAMCFSYWYVKEVFDRNRERADADIFAGLSVAKLYAAFLVFSASFGIAQRYCLETSLLVLAIFCLSFLLVYQALFQHAFINIKNISLTLVLAALIAIIGYIVRLEWGLNYFTAGVFMTAVYNFAWSLLHSYLDKALSWRAFTELLVISLLIILMVAGVTNFKARILDGCYI